MSRLEEIKDEYAKEIGYTNWNDLVSCVLNKTQGIYEQKVANRYATECVKASLEKAYFNHEIFTRNGHDEEIFELNKESITNPDNIVLL